MVTEKRFINHDDTILDSRGEQLISTDEIVDKLNELHEENQLLKQRLAEQNDVEWLRNNTVWEVMPSSHRTFTTTSVKEDYE